MAQSGKEPTAPDEFDVLQERVIRELDKLNERIEAVIGEFVRPRIEDEPLELTRAADDDLAAPDHSDVLRANDTRQDAERRDDDDQPDVRRAA